MICGIALVRDEADIIERVVRHMQAQVDHVIVADNGSMDGTRDILETLGVDIVDDREPGHYQARKNSALAERARTLGAKWVVPFDADELWFARDGRIGDVLSALPDPVLLAQAVLFDHRPTALDVGADPVSRMRWRLPLPLPLRKVACRCLPGLGITQGNHEAGYADVQIAPAALDMLVIRHFPYRTPEQFASKIANGAAAYAATDLPESMGAHKRAYGRILDTEGRAGLDRVFHREFFSQDPASDGLVYDPCP